MRCRAILALAIAISLCPLVFFWHHLRNGTEVVRKYAKFYAYLGQHPETLYRYQGPANQPDAETERNGELIPPIIQQMFHIEGRETLLTNYDAAITKCQAFMRRYYRNLMPQYEGYKQGIQRANILRYALLDHFGGVYLDLDLTCLHALDNLRHLPFLTPGAYPAGVNNAAFILCRPHHGFLKHLLDAVPQTDLLWGLPYVESMLSTGYMFFSNQWMRYVRLLRSVETRVAEEDKVYILADQEGHIESHMLRGAVTTPLFRHGGAGSWHEWNAAVIITMGKHYRYFGAIMALGTLLALAIVRMSRRKPARRRI